MIDLRSDTITRPTPAMLAAMMAAPVGDDVFGEDPTVNALEQKAARLFGMEAALFCPSGTMTNQLAIRTHVRPGDEVICDQISHIYLYEGGGIAVNALAVGNPLFVEPSMKIGSQDATTASITPFRGKIRGRLIT